MAMNVTTVGIDENVRDRLKDYRDREGHPNYNVALDHLLREAE